MKILLHICCGPCAIYPVDRLRQDGHDILGFFFRNNIHPYTECLKRQQTLEAYAEEIDLKVICQQGYDLEGFLQKMVYRENSRCPVCYHERLSATARLAEKSTFDAFSTTLLYSKFQNHEMIRSMGESLGNSIGIPFYYEDFRAGWKEGVQRSKAMNMYRQQYCGCIYSEKDRYLRP